MNKEATEFKEARLNPLRLCASVASIPKTIPEPGFMTNKRMNHGDAEKRRKDWGGVFSERVNITYQ